MVPGCDLGTDVCHWMSLKKVNMVQGQQDGPLREKERKGKHDHRYQYKETGYLWSFSIDWYEQSGPLVEFQD